MKSEHLLATLHPSDILYVASIWVRAGKLLPFQIEL